MAQFDLDRDRLFSLAQGSHLILVPLKLKSLKVWTRKRGCEGAL